MTNSSTSLRLSTLKTETPLQASKWLKRQLLIDTEEMASLFQSLGEFEIYQIGCVNKVGEGRISHEEFLEHYRHYVDALKAGELPDDADYRGYFSSVLTLSPDCLYAVPIGTDQQLIRIAKPVIQLQTHLLGFSPVDGKFRPMVMGNDSILWGIQFSYPQLCLNNTTQEIEKVNDHDDFFNTVLFKRFQSWVRRHTIPTPFKVGEEIVNVPVRLGKECLSWINRHPQLMKKCLLVETQR